MFRSKKDVDRHVQDIFCKLKSEYEKNVRCYNIAKLYYQVGDYESAKRYAFMYLEVREGSAVAHKLLGQAFEALGQKEAAFAQYKISLELEGRQDDLVLKVCELLTDTDTESDLDRIKYWVERADKLFPHHPVIFQLREKMLTVERPNDSGEDLEALIASELSARPTNVQLRVKLLKHYILRHKFDDAYKHATDVEATHGHRNSIAWYQALSELLMKCKETKHNDWSFWILYISSLERYTALSLKEQGNELKKTVPEATQTVFNFDQSLTEFKSKNFLTNSVFTEHMLTHMWGQLHFHLACLLLRKTKQEQGTWNEAGRLCAPLLLGALQTRPVDTTTFSLVDLKAYFKSQMFLWFKEGSYRCSQAGHVLQDYARNDVKKLMDKIDKFCTGSWRERIYQRIFVSRMHQQLMGSSYFCTCKVSNPPLRLCSQSDLKHYDQVSEQVWPDSLHHQIWLGIKSRPYNSQNKDNSPYPHQCSHIFPELQFSVYNLNQSAPDSLSRLDIDAFLNAAVLCASVIIEDQQLSGFLSPERLPTLPADLTTTLCTSAQEEWWLAAYKMYSKQEWFEGDIGKIRQDLQRGLEVVRCIGNHGLHPVILVHLARIFHYRAKLLKEKDKDHSDISSLEARCELYWSSAIPLLERLQNNQTLRMTTSKLFNYQGKEMNNLELTNALEEGKLLLAQYLVRDKHYEQAIDALQTLKCPEASFQQGQIYKLFADELVSSMPRESLTSEMRSQHIIMLSKARNCLYLTLDRLRSPGMNPKHPLNSELCSHISEIENELKQIDPDLWRGDSSRNECDEMSDGSYSSAHSCVDQAITNAPLATLPELGTSANILSTPQRNTHRTTKQTSTPCRPQHLDVLDLSRNRTEARPSPERLDAQIRQMIHSRDNIMQTIIEQNKTLLESNKTIMEKIEDLVKDMAELRKDVQRQRVQTNNPNLEEDLYVLGDEDYSDLNYNANQTDPTSVISGNMFTSSHRHPYSPLVYPSATTFQGYYQSGIPFNDPNVQAIPSLYPPNLYPMPVIYPNQSKMPDNIFQQGLFTSRLPTQLSDLVPPVNQQSQIPIQKADVTKPDSSIKDAPVNKAPPVNVVITTSDTVPTTAPLVQPTLSVTIPAHYRLGNACFEKYISSLIGNTSVPIATEETSAPHSYQISMPSQASVPTTINLPPLFNTFKTTPGNSTMPDVPKENNTNIQITELPNKSAEFCETEHDPIPDFEPVIPLPAEVKITTGEEDEITLYCARAKLFRFVNKQWKERGIGNVKLLQNSEGKVRLLMRRDQVLKICANHMLRPDMELSSMPNNDKAWVWVAHDFADEEVKLEKLCIKFKTVEEARSFKEQFDKAKLSINNSPETMFKTINKIPVSSNTSEVKNSMPYIEDASSTSKTIVQKQTTDTGFISEVNRLENPSATTIPSTRGFTFTSKTLAQNTSSTDQESQKAEEITKVSPFSRISFGKSNTDQSLETTSSTVTLPKITSVADTLPNASSTGGFSLVKTTGCVVSPPCLETMTTTVANNTCDTTSIFSSHSSQSGNVFTNSNVFSHSSLRRPHAPSPASKSASALDGHDETILFEHKAKLQIYNKDVKKWQDRGTGQVKVSLNAKSGKLYLVMHDEQSSKICYKHTVPTNMKFTFKSGSNTIINWTVHDHAKEENKTEMYSVIFESPEQASQFYNTLLNNQQKMAKDHISVTKVKKSESKKASETTKHVTSDTVVPDKLKNLSEFKPPANSWECTTCYVINNAAEIKCIACSSSRSTSATSTSTTSDQGSFSQPCKTSNSSKCPTCVNGNANIYCTICNPLSDSLPYKPKGTNTNLSIMSSETVSTNIPQDIKETVSNTRFSMPVSFDAGNSVKTTTPSVFDNIRKSDDSSTKFILGGTQRPNSPSNKESFTFGSPGKTFAFHLSLSSPAKSPGGGENNEEEVVESEDIHFSPIIPLPDKIEVKTGEEDEEVLYSHRAKLFRYDSNVKEWKERGTGDIKLLKHKESGKLRLIMRRECIHKVCLNHFVSSDLEFTFKDEKSLLWNAADYSEGEIEYTQVACRFKNREIAEEFRKAIDDARKGNASSASTSTKKEPAKGHTPISQDIEVLYEVKVTPEEKAKALRLQLPENFYAYEQKKDCPGCIGCKEPSIPLFNVTQEPSLTQFNTTTEFNNSVAPSNTALKATSIPGKANSLNCMTDASNVIDSPNVTAPLFTSNTSATKGVTLLKPSKLSVKFDDSQSPTKEKEVGISNDKRSVGFTFGASPCITNETLPFASKLSEQPNVCTGMEKQFNAFAENLKVSSFAPKVDKSVPTNFTGSIQHVFGKTQPTFGEGTSMLSPFTTTSALTTQSQSIVSSSEERMFGSTFDQNAPAENISIFDPPVNLPTFESIAQSNNIVQANTTAPLLESKLTSTTMGTFETISKEAAPVFSTTSFSPNLTFSVNSNNSGFRDINTTRSTDNTVKTIMSEKDEGIDFTSVSGVTFATLASNNQSQASFKFDPSFSFAGAGSSIFGSKTVEKSLNSSQSEKKHHESKTKNDNVDDNDDESNDDTQEHDPEFEPIVPLPAVIEVRTGEEEEEKIFCQRAKLFRFDGVAKEWKERGVGEMKILRHEKNGSYRLLLRREQIYKVVCNFLLNPDIKFLTLNSSSRCAWMWAGMNYAEEEPRIEKLAVKFGREDTATKFKHTIDEVQEILRQKQKTKEIHELDDNNEDEYKPEEDGDDDDDNDDDDDDDNDDKDEDTEDEDDHDKDEDEIDKSSVMLEKRATLFIASDEEAKWKNVALGNLIICYDSDIYAARIIFKADELDNVVCNTIVSTESIMQLNGKECTWTTTDYALEVPTIRTLKAVFSSEQAAAEVYTIFQQARDEERQVAGLH